MTKEAAHWSEQEELRSGGSLRCHRDFLSGWCRKLGSHKVTFVWAAHIIGRSSEVEPCYCKGPHPFLMLESM